MTRTRRAGGASLAPLLVFLAGCGGGAKLPPLTDVEGIVLLGGQPLPHALVTFNPTADGLPGGAMATAITDEKGKFTLTTAGKPGAVPGEHIVTVVDEPPPDETRGEDAQEKLNKFRAGLKNRPIPTKYGAVNKSDAKVTVKTDQKEYKIELTR